VRGAKPSKVEKTKRMVSEPIGPHRYEPPFKTLVPRPLYVLRRDGRRPHFPLTGLGTVMQERLSDFVISVALFVVAAFWLWKHMKTGAYVSKRTLRSAEVLIPFLRSPVRSHY
jgi:hypothetical protein